MQKGNNKIFTTEWEKTKRKSVLYPSKGIETQKKKKKTWHRKKKKNDENSKIKIMTETLWTNTTCFERHQKKYKEHEFQLTLWT